MNGRYMAALWLFCLLVLGWLARVALVAVFDVWTPDGRLAVSPAAFAFINVLPVAIGGAVFFWLLHSAKGSR